MHRLLNTKWVHCAAYSVCSLRKATALTSSGVPFRSLPIPSAARSTPTPLPLGYLKQLGLSSMATDEATKNKQADSRSTQGFSWYSAQAAGQHKAACYEAAHIYAG
jgi:hypothetical protein